MRILIAEKDARIRELVVTRLTPRGYAVMEAQTSEEALRLLERNRADLLMVATDMERVGGELLVERIRRNSHLSTTPIILLTEEHRIAEMLLSQERGYDDFLIKPFGALALQLRVSMNIFRARRSVEANALTHLPGNSSIERVIRERIERGEKFSVLYIDISHFKSFNDRYGFERGDDVLRQSAKLLLQTAQSLGLEETCFVGHIGGDDFLVVLAPEQEEAFARAFISRFDQIMPTYYNEDDRKRGFLRIKNRQGREATFPLMSCSIAACNNLYRSYKSLGEIAQDAAEVKVFLKMQEGSHYLRDRRSSPVKKLEEAMHILAPELPKQKVEDSSPLGQVLLAAGLITQDDLHVALKQHFETGHRLGQILIRMNVVQSADVGRMLEKKLGVPYVSLARHSAVNPALGLFTMDFIKTHRVVPLAIQDESVELGMCYPFDLRILDSVERITGLRPVPRLTLEDEFEDFIVRLTEQMPHEEELR